MRRTRINTQVYRSFAGERKQLTFRADGETLPLQVDVDLLECEVCSAAIVPGGRRPEQHADWHARTTS